MRYSIYRVTNLVNGKIYIGVTTRSLADRWSVHCYYAKRSIAQMPISSAIRKYGSASFVMEHIACCRSSADMYALEAVIIRQEKSRDPAIGYNISAGGRGGQSGTVRSMHLRTKASEFMKGNKNAKGAVRSAETRAKMSEARKRRPPMSIEQRLKTAETLRNNPAVAARLRSYNERFTGGRQLKFCFSPGTMG